MEPSSQPPVGPHARPHKEYEDPHYHDADDFESPDAEVTRKPPSAKRRPADRLPPVRRRFED
jgi:hypothetical protein